MASMRLSVYPANLAARKLYEQCGWQAIAIPEKFDQAMYYSKILT